MAFNILIFTHERAKIKSEWSLAALKSKAYKSYVGIMRAVTINAGKVNNPKDRKIIDYQIDGKSMTSITELKTGTNCMTTYSMADTDAMVGFFEKNVAKMDASIEEFDRIRASMGDTSLYSSSPTMRELSSANANALIALSNKIKEEV